MLWPFDALARDLGFAVDTTREVLGIGKGKFRDPDTRVPIEQVDRLLKMAIEASGRADLGLLAAEAAESELWDVPEFAAMNRSTLREAIECFARILPLDITGADITITTYDDMSKTAIHFKPEVQMCPAAHEFAIACFVLAMRAALGPGIAEPIQEIWFMHHRPDDISTHERILGCPIRFNAPEDALLITKKNLELPLVITDSRLSQTLVRIAEDLLARLPKHSGLQEQVQALVAEQLAGGNCSVETVAKSFHMTSRTLRRKLQAEKTSFKDLVDEMRHQLAISYLRQPNLAISEVAYLLGFSSSAAFHRAFKRWTGSTPSGYRKGM